MSKRLLLESMDDGKTWKSLDEEVLEEVEEVETVEPKEPAEEKKREKSIIDEMFEMETGWMR